MPEVILTILGAVLVYLFGRWQGEHQLLYQRRAEVMGELFGRFEDVDQKFHSLFQRYDIGGEPDKPEKAKLAAESSTCTDTTGVTPSGSPYGPAISSATFWLGTETLLTSSPQR